MATLTVQEVLDARLDDWRQLSHALHARFRTGDFAAGLAFLTAVAEAAEAADHHPDVSLAYSRVDLTLLSHDVGAITRRDINLARRISEIAREQGIAAKPSAPTQLELALDTADLAAAGPFWAAVLTGSPDAVKDRDDEGREVVDPSGRVPLLWFQGTDAHETPRMRFHIDLWVPHDVAEHRIAAAVAAGGRVVDDTQSPSFVVLADPEGNKVCVCTCLER